MTNIESVIIGLYRQGNPIERISVYSGVKLNAVAKIINQYLKK